MAELINLCTTLSTPLHWFLGESFRTAILAQLRPLYEAYRANMEVEMGGVGAGVQGGEITGSLCVPDQSSVCKPEEPFEPFHPV